jgi:hypothetical protein
MPTAPGNFGFRISDFGFAAPKPESTAGKPQSAWRLCRTGRAASDDFGIMDARCERKSLAQTSSEGALTGNAAPENRDLQAGGTLPERTSERQMAQHPPVRRTWLYSPRGVLPAPPSSTVRRVSY